MIIKEDGHLDFEQISKMSCEELVNECDKFGPGGCYFRKHSVLPKIPLDDMRKFTIIMFQKKWEKKYGSHF